MSSSERAKSAGSKEHSKFYLLKRMGAAKPVGMIKGVVHSAEFGPKGLVIGTEAGDNLELKVPTYLYSFPSSHSNVSLHFFTRVILCPVA